MGSFRGYCSAAFASLEELLVRTLLRPGQPGNRSGVPTASAGALLEDCSQVDPLCNNAFVLRADNEAGGFRNWLSWGSSRLTVPRPAEVFPKNATLKGWSGNCRDESKPALPSRGADPAEPSNGLSKLQNTSQANCCSTAAEEASAAGTCFAGPTLADFPSGPVAGETLLLHNRPNIPNKLVIRRRSPAALKPRQLCLGPEENRSAGSAPRLHGSRCGRGFRLGRPKSSHNCEG